MEAQCIIFLSSLRFLALTTSDNSLMTQKVRLIINREHISNCIVQKSATSDISGKARG